MSDYGLRAFQGITDSLPGLLAALRACPALARNEWPQLPEARGIYLFEDEGVPVYVGRTNRIRRRIYYHSRPAAPHNQATFAFILARRAAEVLNLDTRRRTRTELQSDKHFGTLFKEAKQRVAGMRVRHVEVADPNVQAIFEVYAAVVLGTEHNTFENH